MPRQELLSEEEALHLDRALAHIEELEHLLKRRPVETFKALLAMKIPIEIEMEIAGGTYAVKLNHDD